MNANHKQFMALRVIPLGTRLLIAILSGQFAFTVSSPADEMTKLREQMVVEEIAAAGVNDPRVLNAMRSTPRHEFVLDKWKSQAYFDVALPIGEHQTISPPYVVAYMTEQLRPQPTDKVLEIGTGSGYQAAVLSPLVKEVYTIEIVERLARRAEQKLKKLGYDNVHVRSGDGYQGWTEAAPFDKIIVTCSPESIPQPLVDQLADGGQIIIPIGERYRQNLVRVTKRGNELIREPLQATLFVPMTGAAEEKRRVLPDPNKPQIFNGDFERVFGEPALPVGWHYLRQASIEREGENHFLRISNQTVGKPTRALQGLAIDGRKVRFVRLSARVRGKDLKPGPIAEQPPAIVLTFYDSRRAVVESEILGPWSGGFDWRTETATIRVPAHAREAIVRLSLMEGLGRLDIDDLSLIPADHP